MCAMQTWQAPAILLCSFLAAVGFLLKTAKDRGFHEARCLLWDLMILGGMLLLLILIVPNRLQPLLAYLFALGFLFMRDRGVARCRRNNCRSHQVVVQRSTARHPTAWYRFTPELQSLAGVLFVAIGGVGLFFGEFGFARWSVEGDLGVVASVGCLLFGSANVSKSFHPASRWTPIEKGMLLAGIICLMCLALSSFRLGT